MIRTAPALLLLALSSGCGASAAPPTAPAALDPAADRDRQWTEAYGAGVKAYQAGDKAAAATQFERARSIAPGRPDASLNLAILAIEAGDAGRAATFYREVLDKVGTTAPVPPVTVDEVRQKAIDGLMAAGSLEFQAGRFEPAAALFGEALGAFPGSREARYNRVLALIKLDRWDEVAPLAAELQAAEPLSKNTRLIEYNRLKAIADAADRGGDKRAAAAAKQTALAALAAADGLPVYLDEVAIDGPAGQQVIRGEIVGNTAAAGTRIKVTFALLAPAGEVATTAVELTAPARGARAPFEQSFTVLQGPRATSYRYAVE